MNVVKICCNGALNDKFLKIWSTFFIGLLPSFLAIARNFAPPWSIAVADFPVQAQQTLAVIERGGPFSYGKDGAVFGNYEKIRLPQKLWVFREYTVKTPYARNSGARLIITGGEPAHAFCYTGDHYVSFQRIEQ